MSPAANRKLVRSGLVNATKAYHKLGANQVTEVHPNVREAFDLLDECILDLKEALGFARDGDWRHAATKRRTVK